MEALTLPASRTHPKKASPAPSRIIIPVRYSAWLNGDLGRSLERTLSRALEGLDADVVRLHRAFVVTADEEPGVLLEAVHRAATALEAGAENAYPVLYHELGSVWTGTLQSVFPEAEA